MRWGRSREDEVMREERRGEGRKRKEEGSMKGEERKVVREISQKRGKTR